ncbi:toll/interleukin-1 receptor domain-containing protein [Microvirga guangxiensis]|uniref:TIR domain-containing protein n=1 Tax=Microvirga guangxiensis TaxID=549386 RepID=A0A1G5IQA7_9HYPH|nr:toll/interleukin-1 receptor domain-containing protein [Microvirga guangxiensis]SCY78276.1 TIR domain-containing protein [Microvirga guangxiensis]
MNKAYPSEKSVSTSYYLPSKIGSYLKRLDLEYSRDKQSLKGEIIKSARAIVIENTEYDNWNGGTTGHDVRLFLPEGILSKIGLSSQVEIGESLRVDLNTCCTHVENEFFRAVQLELNDEHDPEYQRAIPLSQRPQINPDNLSIWKPGLVRLFISHRDEYKRVATDLADALEIYGIGSFVAHDTIEPTREWRREIMNGLETMEVMLVFLTDNFSESIWTNQEVGFALGKGVPIISLKLEKKDPPGFISHEQALRSSLSDPASSAKQIQKLVAEKLGRRDRIQSGLIAAFLTSPDWNEARDRFEAMASTVETLSDREFDEIVQGFYKNNQLYGATYLVNARERLKTFLEKTSGKKIEIKGREIKEIKTTPRSMYLDDDIPF